MSWGRALVKGGNYLQRIVGRPITPPALVDDPADAPDLHAEFVSPLRCLNLREAKVSTVIGATGFMGDFS